MAFLRPVKVLRVQERTVVRVVCENRKQKWELSNFALVISTVFIPVRNNNNNNNNVYAEELFNVFRVGSNFKKNKH